MAAFQVGRVAFSSPTSSSTVIGGRVATSSGGVLWPYELPSASEAGLNALVSKLRKALGAGVLDGRSTLWLRLPDDVQVDVEAAVAAAVEAAVEAVHRAESQMALGNSEAAWGTVARSDHRRRTGVLA